MSPGFYLRLGTSIPIPFTFLTFVVSLEAIFLSTFILISQNHEELLARRRNHLDLQINLLSEQENSQILKMLANIESRLEIQHDEDEEALQQCVKPEELVSQIENVIEHVKKDRSGAVVRSLETPHSAIR